MTRTGTRRRLAVIGAIAAVAGGTMWIVKAGVILGVGDQPPLPFEAGLLLFPFALVGLHSRLEGSDGRCVWATAWRGWCWAWRYGRSRET